MSKPKRFERTKKVIFTGATILGSLATTGVIGEGTAQASGPDMSYLVTDAASKVISYYNAFSYDPAIATETTHGNDTEISIDLPSVYGSFIVSATVSSLTEVNQNTVSNISIAAYLPYYAAHNANEQIGYYNLSLSNGDVVEADALYINNAGTKFLNIIDKPQSWGAYNQPVSGTIAANVYKASFTPNSPVIGKLKIDSQQKNDANLIGYTLDKLISEAHVGMPIDAGTIAPVFPLAGNFK